jgi:hypothetical protein
MKIFFKINTFSDIKIILKSSIILRNPDRSFREGGDFFESTKTKIEDTKMHLGNSYDAVKGYLATELAIAEADVSKALVWLFYDEAENDSWSPKEGFNAMLVAVKNRLDNVYFEGMQLVHFLRGLPGHQELLAEAKSLELA